MVEDHQEKEGAIVARRRVFYIPGYDPIHPRRYRELYRKEGREQAALSDYFLELRPKTTKGPYGWHVDAEIEGQKVAVDMEVLVWSDIVRDSMAQGIVATYLQLVRTAWIYITSGALRRLMWLRKGPVIAALYPVGMLILQLVPALCAGHVTGHLGAWIVSSIPIAGDGTAFVVKMMLCALTYWAIFAAAVYAVLRWFKSKDGKFFAYYLMHDYAYSAQSKGETSPELEGRMPEFGTAIAEALTTDVDEILVVGHSSGAHLAVSILADLYRGGRVPARATLGFLSLGQVVPMVSFLPKAWALRSDLQYLSTVEDVTWVDVTAPGDGCAFALCDPVAVSGVAVEGKKWPLVISAAFTQTLSPARWKELRWRFFRLHFQYLCAFDRPGDYDYFQITAGPKTLRERFEDRPASKSRIDVAASKYTSVAP